MIMENDELPKVQGMSPYDYVGLMYLIFLFPYLGWMISLVLWVVGRKQSEYVNKRGKDFINWLISSTLYTAIFIGVVIGGDLTANDSSNIVPIVATFWGFFVLGCLITAGVKSLHKQTWNFPLVLKIFK